MHPIVTNRQRGVSISMSVCLSAHWRHLANTTEPCMFGGDAALCQITLTTEYSCFIVIAFCVRHSRDKMHIGYSRLCVCLSLAAFQHYCMDPDVTWWHDSCALFGEFAIGAQVLVLYVCKLIALYTANASSAECEMSASACSRCMAGFSWVATTVQQDMSC